MSGYFYILANRRNGALYVGATNDLARRVDEHKNGVIPGFTKKYKIDRLVYFESHDDKSSALLRERRVKGWERKWKIALIEKENAEWRDLSHWLK